MLEDVEIIPDLVGSLVNYSKRYLYNQIYTILRDWSLDDLLEDFKFPKYRS
ncbi:MAG: hypothetical protein ACFFAU_14295 [Candidatus Hodarchaeota archaeon]